MTIHGFLTVKEDFGRLYDFFDCYDEVLAVEIPGHNGDASIDDFTVEDTFSTVLSAYDKLRAKYDQVDVVGFSMGGALATWLCVQRDVHYAVLLSPANKYLNFLMPVDTIKFYNERGLQPLLDRDVDVSLADVGYEVKQTFISYFENVATSLKIALDSEKKISLSVYNVFRKIIKQCNKAVEQNSPIKTPMLVLWGRLDELVPHKAIEYVLEHFNNATSKIYEDIGHAMLYTNHDDVLIVDIMKFLTDGLFCAKIPHK